MMTVINAALEILGDNAALKTLGALEILGVEVAMETLGSQKVAQCLFNVFVNASNEVHIN